MEGEARFFRKVHPAADGIHRMSSLNRLAAPQGVLAPFAALVAGAVAMGISPIFVRLADVGPFTSAFWRAALALPLLYAWMRLADGEGRVGRAVFQSDDPGGTGLRRRSLLLASVDRSYERHQCDILRHHRADLGRPVRLAPVPAAGEVRRPRRAFASA